MTTEIDERLQLDKMRSGPRRQTREASPGECAAVAARLDLEGVKSITFDMNAAQSSDADIYEVIGQVTMEATRICSVTNKPFLDVTQAMIHELFTAKPAKATDEDAEIESEIDTPDVELVEDETIDLGELVIQYLAMELDPAPHAPNARPDAEDVAAGLDADRILPFAGLADMLKSRDDGNDEPGSKL